MSLADKPAFPCPKKDSDDYNYGMTLREYYAGLAMQALIAFYASKDQNEDVIADLACIQADALIKKLEDGN